MVLFTLYLKEDVDEEGHVKEGVEGGKPFELLSEEKRERNEKMKNGEGVSETTHTGKENFKGPETSADDLD